MELMSLLASIPRDEHGIDKTRGRDTLASTGVLWAECDKMMALGLGGLTKIAAERVEEYHGLLKDAIAELEHWDPDEDSESDTDSLTSNNENVKDLSLSPLAASRNRTLANLRIIRVLYPAIVKRRVLTFPNITSSTTAESLPSLLHIRIFDELIDHTKRFTEETDEIAGALYEGEEEEVENRLSVLRGMAKICAEEIRLGWGGNEDEFTSWVEKWMARLVEVKGG